MRPLLFRQLSRSTTPLSRPPVRLLKESKRLASMETDTKPALEARLNRWRQVITSVCMMLQQVRSGAGRFGAHAYSTNADCHLLLVDATRLFCDCVCEQFGELPHERWSALLPDLLLTHPARCLETLALIEQRQFKAPSHQQFDAA